MTTREKQILQDALRMLYIYRGLSDATDDEIMALAERIGQEEIE